MRTAQPIVPAAVVLVDTGPGRSFCLSITTVTVELALFVRRRHGVTMSKCLLHDEEKRSSSVLEACISVLFWFGVIWLSSLLCNEC